MHEKMYFKRYASFHVIGQQNNYGTLFDAINRQKQYDEKKIIAHFRHHAFVRQFPVAKNRLYSQILNALRSYHHSIHSNVRDQMHNAEILYEKRLFRQSHKVIIKTKQLAQEHELHYAMMEIFRYWEMNLAVSFSDVPWMQNIIREESSELSLYQNTKVYRDIYFQIGIHHYLHGTTRDKKHLSQIKKILRSPLLLNEHRTKTFEAKLRFHAAHGFYCRIINDKRGLYLATKNTIALFKKHPEKIKHAFSAFIVHLSNMLDACAMNEKYNEIPLYLKELESLAPFARSSAEKAALFYNAVLNRLNYYNITGQSSGALSFMEEINKQLDAHKQFSSDFEKAKLFQTIAISCFLSERYKYCIHWLNRIRNEVSLNVRPDFESFLRLFYLIAQYEAGNLDLLPPLIQSLYRYLKRKKHLYKFEATIIYFLRNELPKTNTKGQFLQALQKLKNNITLLSKDPYEKNPFEYFDYISWLESKIKNRPFSEIIREKVMS